MPSRRTANRLFFFALCACIVLIVVRSRMNESVIIESPDITVISQFLKCSDYAATTLVIFDIDNTLIQPIHELGSDQWFYAMVKQFESEGNTHDLAVQKVLPTALPAIAADPYRLVQDNSPQFIADLQKSGVTVLALTARSLQLIPATLKQLHAAGIDFSFGSTCNEYEDLSLCHRAACCQGIIYSTNNNKGEVLTHFFDKAHYHPRKVIFIDDKAKNINDVVGALVKRHIPVVGIRYCRLDAKIKAFNLERTRPALEEFYRHHPTITPRLIQTQ